MNKKIIALLLVVCVLVPATLSASIVNLSIGGTAQYNRSFSDIQSSIDNDTLGEDLAELDYYEFGADIRLKILLAEIDVVGMFGSSNNNTTISMLTSAGISLDILNFARLGLGMGPRFNVMIDSDGNISGFDDFGEAFINSPVAYRATLDFKIGKMMLGLNYTVDTTYTFKEPEKVENLFNAPLDSGKMGVSLLFSLF